MMSKRLLVASEEEGPVNGAQESNEDVFYWAAGSSRKTTIEALADLNPVICGVNRISQKICQSFEALGVPDVTLIDDPALRNTEFFDRRGRFSAKSFGVPECIAAKDFYDMRLTTGCVIATSEFGSPSFLLPWNSLCCGHNVHFMPVYLKDMIGYAGPLVIPGDTPCLQCVRMRQNAHLRHPAINTQIEKEMERGYPIAAIHPAMVNILAETAVFELVHFYGALPEPRPGRLIVIDLAAGKTESKRVLKIPRCPVCSSSVSTAGVQVRKLTPLPE
jgi:bacteriocin biosynthesis cyclodehydratase domain-containing protein